MANDLYSSGQPPRRVSPIIKIASLVGAFFLAIIILSSALSSFYTVDQGERAVVIRNGATIGVSQPGLHWKVPYVDGVEDISIQPMKIEFGNDPNDKVEAYSSDQQPATIRFAVNYHVTDPQNFYANYTNVNNMENRILSTKVFEVVKNIFGQFEAASAIRQRARLNSQITFALQQTFSGLPFKINSFQMEDIAFSPKYEAAVEDRMEATVRQQQAEFAKAKRIIDADAAAYEVKAAADAKAHQITVQGNAEANAIKARGDALRNNPNLVSLTLAEHWKGDSPKTIIPGSTAPFIKVGGE